MVTVVVPCYNEEEALPFFLNVISVTADKLMSCHGEPCEFLFIDDGSSDRTLELLREAAQRDERIRYLSFSRNFGKEAGLFAGLEHALGDYVVIMDADLQHPPAMLEEMYLALKSGQYEIAAARRVNRKGEPPLRSWLAHRFYKLINRISGATFVDGASDFRMLSRAAVNAVLEMREYNRFSKGIFGWIGFRTKWIEYENVERVAGETKWSFWKLFLYSLEGIVGYSTVPLAVSSVIGMVFFTIAILWMVKIVIETILYGNATAGFPTLACLLLLIGGSIQLSLGIIGQYLAKTYLEAKHRPIYLIAETEKTGCAHKDKPESSLK